MPTTKAGERLLANSAGRTHMKDTARYEETAALIDAIEAEAREEIGAAMEGRLARALHLARHNHSGLPMSADQTCGPTGQDRREAAAVLAILDEEDEA